MWLDTARLVNVASPSTDIANLFPTDSSLARRYITCAEVLTGAGSTTGPPDTDSFPAFLIPEDKIIVVEGPIHRSSPNEKGATIYFGAL
jgi:hypothetical protein